MARFADVDELGLFLGRDIPDETGAELLLRIASASIQAATRQLLEFVEDDEISLEAPMGRLLELPEAPVISVASVTLGDGVVVDGVEYAILRAGALKLDATRHGAHGRWTWQPGPVAVTYTHGFAVVPDAIKGVCMAIAGRILDDPGNVESESIGPYAVTYGAKGQPLPTVSLIKGELAQLGGFTREAIG